MPDPLTVIGLGADGWPGLSPTAQQAITTAEVLLGSTRQLALIPTIPPTEPPTPTHPDGPSTPAHADASPTPAHADASPTPAHPDASPTPAHADAPPARADASPTPAHLDGPSTPAHPGEVSATNLGEPSTVRSGSAASASPALSAEGAALPGQVRVAWSSPLSESLPGLLATHRGRRICVLASGDPTFHGIGTTLTRMLGAEAVRVIPHPSSVSLACARLGWPQDQVQVISLVGHPLELVQPHVQPGRRLVILSWGAQTPGEVAELLVQRGYGGSAFTVLEQLGSGEERVRSTRADEWSGEVDALNVIGVLCAADDGVEVLSTAPGLPDSAYESDGQLTKREVRAVTLSRLAPVPGQLLWDVGGGAGSIAIEWLRHHPSCRAVAIEQDPDRAKRLDRNATTLGVAVRTVVGSAPAALEGLESPDAIFVGGGATVPGVIETCWQALRPGGRLVVNGVTLETEALIAHWYAELGGDLVRLAVQRASAVGTMTGWRPAMPVTIWSLTK